MIKIKATENFAGVEITGEYNDFDNLYETLHKMTGSEGEFPYYKGIISRVYNLCYELRHAMMGDREYVNEDNGVHDHTFNMHQIILPRVNVHLKFNILFPELLFIVMSLNVLLKKYAAKISKDKFSLYESKECLMDTSIATIRLFQGNVMACIKEHVSDNLYSRMLRQMTDKYHDFYNYHQQYIDLLNIKHIKMTAERRQKNLSIIVKRIYEKNDDYQSLSMELEDASIEYKCDPSELRFVEEYPEDIEW